MTAPLNVTNVHKQIRPPTLSSTALRARLNGLGRDPTQPSVARTTADTIDRLANIYDGLLAVRSNRNPLQTAEAVADQYKRDHEAAMQRVKVMTDAAVSVICGRQEDLASEAFRRAGLATEPAGAAEVRSALRAMPPKARAQAVQKAMKEGDAVILGAILHSPSPILTGDLGFPFKSVLQERLDERFPELKQEREDLDFAAQSLTMAASGFVRGANNLRDGAMEARAEKGGAAADAAAAQLAAALGTQGAT